MNYPIKSTNELKEFKVGSDSKQQSDVMDIKKVRIGNIFCTNNPEAEFSTVFDVSITAGNDFVARSGEYVIESWAKETPLLITEEWLLKLGFSKIAHRYYAPNSKDIKKVGISFEFVECRVKGIPSYFEDQDIKFVHELQNMHFKNTGEELVIIA